MKNKKLYSNEIDKIFIDVLKIKKKVYQKLICFLV